MGSQELTRIWNQTRRGANQRRIPDREIENFSSPHVFSFQGDSWVIGRFSTSNERLVFLGGNLGTIGILDVRHTWDSPTHEAPPASCITAHRGLIMDLAEVPCSSAQSIDLLSASGDTTIRQWNLERCREVMTFTGHDRTVRSLSVNKDDPWMFISSSRDGTIQRWDRRCSKARDVYADPHSLEAMTRTLTPRKGRQRRSENPELSITSVQFVNKNQFVSGSVKADTGVRLWDLRFMKTKTTGSYTPVKIFNIKNSQNKAISCLTIDRFGSSLYAAVTDKNVYEFSLNSDRTTPVHVFSGARINLFDVAQMSISPVSDHLMCGSNDGTAVIWDLQETHLYVDDHPSVRPLSSICEIEPIGPKFQLNGHQEQVISVGWSASGNYMLTIDEEQLRVWDKNRPYSETLKDSTQIPGAFERIQKRRPTAIPVSRLRASLDYPPADNSLLSPSKDTAMRSAKRVAIEAFQSPQKRIARNGHSPRTPQAKRIRIEQISPVLPPLITSPSTNKQLSPLIDMQKTPVKTPNKTPRKRMLLRPKNAFHAKYPTWKLPNIRYENYIKKIRGKAEEKSTPNNDPLASIASPSSMDDWLRRPAKGGHPSRLIRLQVPAEDEFTEASCSKMMTEAERLEARSPMKKVIKTPVKATQGIPLVPQPLISPAPSTMTTPRNMQRKLKFSDENTPKANSASKIKIKTPASNSRNILHYFPRTPK